MYQTIRVSLRIGANPSRGVPQEQTLNLTKPTSSSHPRIPYACSVLPATPAAERMARKQVFPIGTNHEFGIYQPGRTCPVQPRPTVLSGRRPGSGTVHTPDPDAAIRQPATQADKSRLFAGRRKFLQELVPAAATDPPNQNTPESTSSPWCGTRCPGRPPGRPVAVGKSPHGHVSEPRPGQCAMRGT